MLLDSPALSSLHTLPGGRAGTRATLRVMARLAKSGKTDLRIRECAADLVQWIPGQEYGREAAELFCFVRDKVRYLQDVNGVETVQSPDVTLQNRYGDCDDKAVLLAALLESIGHPARFIAVGFRAPGEFDHVFVETRIGADWVACDPTVPDAPFGWSPARDSQPLAYMRQDI